MGDNKAFHGIGRESSGGGKGSFYGATHWSDHIIVKRPRFKVEPKLIALIMAEILGIKIADWIIGTVNNTQGTIMFIVLLTYIGVRIYFIIRFGLLRIRREEKELRDGVKVNGKHQGR